MIQKQIKEVRKSKGITQEQIFKAIGMSHDRYSRFESGDGVIRPSELSKILAHLRLEVVPMSDDYKQQAIIEGIRSLNALIS